MNPRTNLRAMAAFLALAVAGHLAAAPAATPFYKGVTVSCQTWGREWTTPAMEASLDELKGLGVNSIAIHPYGQIANDGHIRFHADQSYVTTPLDWAYDRGLSVMLVPHIAYWGSKFAWRGEIDFATAAEWDTFFTDYETWIVEMARIAQAHHAAIFCVGLEFTHAQKFSARWLRIIKAVRGVYFGKLTYGANWNEYADVPFWDALDYIGVLAYFPLTKTPDPPAAELARAWDLRCAELGRFSRRNGGKQILFTEIGYNEYSRTAATPWAFQQGGEHAAAIQARCLDIALDLGHDHPFLAGMFLWKWFPDSPDPAVENYRLQTPALKALITQHWK